MLLFVPPCSNTILICIDSFFYVFTDLINLFFSTSLTSSLLALVHRSKDVHSPLMIKRFSDFDAIIE